MAYESDSRPQMNLDDAEALLPCREGVWDAGDEIEWQQAQNSYNGQYWHYFIRSALIKYQYRSLY